MKIISKKYPSSPCGTHRKALEFLDEEEAEEEDNDEEDEEDEEDDEDDEEEEEVLIFLRCLIQYK